MNLFQSGTLTQIEAFPIDIGDSYERVLFSCGLDEYDQNSVITARNKVLDEIRASINKRQGNSLKSTMLDLKAYTTDYAKNQCDDLQKHLNELIDEKEALKRINDKKEKRISECGMKISELECYHSRYTELCQYVVKINSKPFIESVEEVAQHYSKRGKIKDSDHTLVGEVRDILISFIQNKFSEYTLSCDKTESETLYEKINMNIDFEATVGDKLYKGGLFSKATKHEDFVDLLYDMTEAFIDQLSKEIVEHISFQKSSIMDYNDDYFRYQQWKTESERDIVNNTERITTIDNEIEGLFEKIETIEGRKEADKMIIDDYLRIADIEFNKYKNNLLETLDSDKLQVEDKVAILIYLCIIEKDFNSISEMG